jgi:hypothetical protein
MAVLTFQIISGMHENGQFPFKEVLVLYGSKDWIMPKKLYIRDLRRV